MYCAKCGTKAQEVDVFCTNCGFRLKLTGGQNPAANGSAGSAQRPPGADVGLPDELEREVRRIEKICGVEVPPKSAEELLDFAGRCFKMGMHDKAIEACLEAVRLKPEFSDAWGFLGNQYVAVGLLDEAVRALSETVRLNPQDAIAWADLGDVYMQKRAPEQAVRALEEALRLKLPPHVAKVVRRDLWEAVLRDAKRACSKV